MHKFLSFIMSFLRIVHLGPDGKLFHRGFILRTKFLKIFMHRFLMSDPDKEFHNHPFKWSFSIILWGAYEEERLVNGKITTKWCLPGSINIIKSTDFHRVNLLTKEVYTLFFAGPKTKEWGFFDPNSLVYESNSDFFRRKNISTNQDIRDID